MIIKKIFNNNALVAENNLNEEYVIMGSGVGFKQSAGNEVDENRIEKLFILKEKDVSDKFKSLLEDVPSEYISLCYDIIEYAKRNLNAPVSDYIYVTLTDHISNLFRLYDEGIKVTNPLIWEIKKFYPKEFDIGQKALDIIETTLNKTLSQDEAGNIALHFINAQINCEYPNAVDVVQQMKKIQDILNIVKYKYNIVLDEKSISYERFITHLRFFFQRIESTRKPSVEDDFLLRQVKSKYIQAYECMLEIEKYLKFELSDEEKLYLTIHIDRVTRR